MDDLKLIDVLKEKNSSIDLKDLLLNSDLEDIKEVIDSVYAVDIALIVEDFDQEEILAFYEKIKSEHMAMILEQSTEYAQSKIVNELSQRDLLLIFKHMSNDDITDVIGNLRTDRKKEMINLMKNNEEVQNLLLYKPDSVGGIMTTEFISLKENLKASDALIKIKQICSTSEVIETIFVVDNKHKLVGTADLRAIFIAKENETLKDIMDDNIITLSPLVDQEEASNTVSKYDLKVIGVVNRRGSLLGIVTVDDVIDVLVEEHTEDILKFGGVSEEEGIHTPAKTSIRIRLPWLILNLFTAFLAAFVVERFEGVISEVVALSAMMPIVAGMSGNAGSQTLVIIIRGITLGEISLKKDWRRVFKEVMVGIVNAFLTGCIAAVVIYVMYGNIVLSIIIIVVMILSSIVSAVCGFFIPLILKALKFDPALASNIFLTTATDTLSFLILLALASGLLHYII